MKIFRFIINPKAGHGKAPETISMIESWPVPSDIKFEIALTEYAGHAIELTKTAVKENCFAVIAVGGDGTVNEVAGSLMYTNCLLGILPMGSGNGLARHIGYSMNVRKAIQQIIAATEGLSDVIQINNHFSVNVSGLGFDGYVAYLFNHSGKRGISTYTTVALKSYASYAAAEFHIESDAIRFDMKAHMLVIANGSQFGNKALIAPNASLEDGRMNIILVRKPPLYRLPGLFYRLFTGTLKDAPWIKSFTCREMTVKASRELHLHIDGETKEMAGRLEIKVLPGTLRILKVG